jgi:hypothetical protein
MYPGPERNPAVPKRGYDYPNIGAEFTANRLRSWTKGRILIGGAEFFGPGAEFGRSKAEYNR